MTCREHANKIYDAPRAFTEQIETTGEGNDVFMTQVVEIKDFKTIIAHVKLPPTEDADATNLPLAIKAWAVEDSEDPSGTQIKIWEKCLDDITDWSGYMFLEISDTHIAQYLGAADSGRLPYLYFSLEGPDNTTYDIIVVLSDPYYREPSLLLENNS